YVFPDLEYGVFRSCIYDPAVIRQVNFLEIDLAGNKHFRTITALSLFPDGLHKVAEFRLTVHHTDRFVIKEYLESLRRTDKHYDDDNCCNDHHRDHKYFFIEFFHFCSVHFLLSILCKSVRKTDLLNLYHISTMKL